MVATAAAMQRLFARLEALPQVTLVEIGGAALAERAEAIAAQMAALPAEALSACKSCIAAAGDPGRDGYAEELAQSRRLYRNEATRQRVSAFLAKRSST